MSARYRSLTAGAPLGVATAVRARAGGLRNAKQSKWPGAQNRFREHVSQRRRGRAPLDLPDPFAAVLGEYTEALRLAPLSDQTWRTYTSKVRQYLAWLTGADLDRDPLASTDGRDWAVRDYRTHLQTVLKRSPAAPASAR
jgi:integrase/recombinase XerC